MPKPRQSRDNISTPLDDLLRGYIKSAGTNRSCAIRDLLTELMHLCAESDEDFDGRLCAAREVYHQERAAGLARGGGR